MAAGWGGQEGAGLGQGGSEAGGGGEAASQGEPGLLGWEGGCYQGNQVRFPSGKRCSVPLGWDPAEGLAGVAGKLRGEGFHLETLRNHRVSVWAGPREIYLFMYRPLPGAVTVRAKPCPRGCGPCPGPGEGPSVFPWPQEASTWAGPRLAGRRGWGGSGYGYPGAWR